MIIREYIFIACAIIVIIQKLKKKIFFRVKLIKRTVWWSRFINNLTHFLQEKYILLNANHLCFPHFTCNLHELGHILNTACV